MAEDVKIVDPGEGSGYDYPSLNLWEAGEDGDGGGNEQVAKCRATDGDDDTTAVTVSGFSNNGSYIKIYTDTGESYRHPGKWDTTKYLLTVEDATALLLADDNCIVQGLQAETHTPTANGRSVYYFVGGSGNHELSYCIGKGHNDSTYYQYALFLDISGATINVYNTIIWNVYAGITSVVCRPSNGTVNIENCTFQGGIYGLRNVNATTNCYNVYIYDSSSSDFVETSGTLTCDYCASEDETADDFLGANNLTSITVTFTDAANGDFSTSDTDIDDEGGSSPPAGYTDDIAGTTRSNWSIGAWEVAGGDVIGTHTAFSIAVTKGSHVGVVDILKTHTAESLAVTKGSHTGVVDVVGIHTAESLALTKGTHIGIVGSQGIHSAKSLAVTKGSHTGVIDIIGIHTAYSLEITKGTHTGVVGGNIIGIHTAFSIAVTKGSHSGPVDIIGGHTAFSIEITKGSHTGFVAINGVHTAKSIVITNGIHVGTVDILGIHTAFSLALTFGIHAGIVSSAVEYFNRSKTHVGIDTGI